MRRCLLVLSMCAAVLAPVRPALAETTSSRADIEFVVTGADGQRLVARGGIFTPTTCQPTAALLLVHGLSYGEYAWDFGTVNDTRYSVARDLAEAGYAAIAIDLPGYGESDKPQNLSGYLPQNTGGYTLTVEAYADMVGEIVAQLRPAFAKVGLVGHSAGTEISELAAVRYDVDALVATGYHHFPSQRIITDFFTGDFGRAAQADYEYFGGTEQGRNDYMYGGGVSDPDVRAADHAQARLTPSGEVYSIGPQPSRYVQASITEPVLLVLAEHDLLFPLNDPNTGASLASLEREAFASSSDTSLLIADDAGHSFMLHSSAAVTTGGIAVWLRQRLPACA